MRSIPPKQGFKKNLFLAFALTVGMSLTGCTTVDNLLGGDSGDMTADATDTAPAATAPVAASPAPVAAATGGAPVATITPVAIDPGTDTGTAVNKTIQGLRAQISGLQSKLAANSAQFANLRNMGLSAASAYQQATGHIATRLQVGTTRGNPELVAEWNIAQNQLDAITANINALNALGTDVANDSSAAHYALNQVDATFNVSGAVDEDHRQLALLEDETSQSIVMIDRLLKEVSDSVQRQTAYAATERGNLTTLAASIKSGDLFGGGAVSNVAPVTTGGSTPLVVVKFDRPDVDYQQILYTTLRQALQNRPGASFQVVAVSPTRGTAASVQIAQTAARRHAEDMMRAMTDMGVPASRLGVTSITDPGTSVSEVRVFLR